MKTGIQLRMTGRVLPMLCLALLTACGGGDFDGQAVGERVVAVTLTEAGREDVQVELFSVGRLISKNTPTLAAEINARVIEFLVDEGDVVQQGQELILLDTTASDLARREALADIQRLKVSIANEERRVARYRDLKTKDMMPQERLDDAEAKLAVDRASLTAALARLAIAEDRLEKARMTSPVNGIVERRHVSVGDYVKVGGPMVTVTDNRSLRAELPFPETVGGRLRVGQGILLESPLAPGHVVEAEVNHIRPQVGSMSRAVVVIVELENPGPWRPEGTVEAKLVVESRAGAVVVPMASLVKRPAGDVVFVPEGPAAERVRQRVVTVGERQNGHIEIREGLDAGELVVAEGAQYLTDGARVTVQEDDV
jgi:membrane fusion protein (multidrug efflux system)